MLGTTVISGMLLATSLGIFLVPSLFVAVERLIQRFRRARPGAATPSDDGPVSVPGE